MPKFSFLNMLLLMQAIGLLVYTGMVGYQEGWSLFDVFLSNIKALNWSGQFNLDFLCYLLLSGWWIMWRHRFQPVYVFWGVVAMILGIVFFAPFLLRLLYLEKGDVKRMLIGHPAAKEVADFPSKNERN